MDFELRVAREKLEREQRERKARAKAKMEKEKRAKAEAARQRDALEAAQRAKQLDAQRAQLQVTNSTYLFIYLLIYLFFVQLLIASINVVPIYLFCSVINGRKPPMKLFNCLLLIVNC